MDENETARTLGRIEGKVDMILDNLKNHEQRIAATEKRIWYGSGIAAAFAFIATKLHLG